MFGVVGALSISRVHVVSMNHLGEKLTQYNLDPCYNTLGIYRCLLVISQTAIVCYRCGVCQLFAGHIERVLYTILWSGGRFGERASSWWLLGDVRLHHSPMACQSLLRLSEKLHSCKLHASCDKSKYYVMPCLIETQDYWSIILLLTVSNSSAAEKVHEGSRMRRHHVACRSNEYADGKHGSATAAVWHANGRWPWPQV